MKNSKLTRRSLENKIDRYEYRLKSPHTRNWEKKRIIPALQKAKSELQKRDDEK